MSAMMPHLPACHESQGDGSSPGRVLLVEETLEEVHYIRTILEEMRLTVFCETQGYKAVAAYHREHPDLLILDIALPDLDGWKVLNTIRAERRTSHDPVVIVTTKFFDPANRMMAQLQGVHSYIRKPFSPEQLEHAVMRALGLL